MICQRELSTVSSWSRMKLFRARFIPRVLLLPMPLTGFAGTPLWVTSFFSLFKSRLMRLQLLFWWRSQSLKSSSGGGQSCILSSTTGSAYADELFKLILVGGAGSLGTILAAPMSSMSAVLKKWVMLFCLKASFYALILLWSQSGYWIRGTGFMHCCKAAGIVTIFMIVPPRRSL